MGLVSYLRSRTPNQALKLLLAAALLMHLVSNVGIYMLKPESISTTPDPLDYRLAALHLLHDHAFTLVDPALKAPELLRTPAYPFVVALGYILDGETGLAVILLQSFLLVGMGYLLYRVLTAFRIPERIAFWLVALYLFEPFQWLYTLHTMTETLTSFMVMALLAGAFVGRGIDTRSRAALYGLGVGLLIFIKPSALMWAPFLVALLACAAAPWKERILRIALALVCAGLVLMPWMLRNESLTGSYILSSSSPFNLIYFLGTERTTPARYNEVLETVTYNGHEKQLWYAYTADAYPMLLEGKEAIVKEDSFYRTFVTRQLMCAPTVWFGFVHLQNEEVYGHEYSLLANLIAGPNEARDRVINVLDTVLWTLFLLLTILGSFVLLRDGKTRWPFLALLGMLGATILMNFCAAWVRVLLPLYPVIVLAAGSGVVFLVQAIRTRALP